VPPKSERGESMKPSLNLRSRLNREQVILLRYYREQKEKSGPRDEIAQGPRRPGRLREGFPHLVRDENSIKPFEKYRPGVGRLGASHSRRKDEPDST